MKFASALLVIYVKLFIIANGTTANVTYRFMVYPVSECPVNEREFETAAKKMNCTGRYLCAPNRDLTNLIQFCTDRNRALFAEGNCVRLEGTGDLNHYNCSNFTSGCPNAPYADDEIFKHPACLNINTVSRCFVSENGCSAVRGTDTGNENEMLHAVPVVYGIVLTCILALATAVIFYLRRNRSYKETEINMDDLRQFLLKDGQLTICHARCIIIGCTGAGKTTFLRRLEGAKLKKLKHIKGTELLDVHVNDFEVLEDKNTIEYVQESNFDKPQTIQLSKNDITPKEKNNSSNTPHVRRESALSVNDEGAENINSCEGESQKQHNENIHTDTSEANEDESAKTRLLQTKATDVPEKEAQKKKKISDSSDIAKASVTLKESDATQKDLDDFQYLYKKGENARITFLDFAGQHIYYAFHQIYLSPKAVYILVLDMTKGFDERDDKIQNEDENLNRFETWTYKDYYTFWLKSIDSFSSTESPVIVVGTHEDKLSHEDPKSFFQRFRSLFKGREDLERHFNRKRFFHIGFPKNGSKLDDLRGIKTCIANIVTHNQFSKETINSKWAIFEHLLEKKKEEKIVSWKKLLDYNAELEIDFQLPEDEITKVLQYLNRVGSLLYNDEDTVRNTVILDVQWFVDAFKCIITDSVDMDKPTDIDIKKFHDTGELQDHQLEAIWKKFKSKKYWEHKKEIITYMENLGLLAVCDSKRPGSNPTTSVWYYFPSLNRKTFDKERDIPKAFKPSSILCFQFNVEKQLPVFVFYALVSKCNKLRDWTIFVQDEKKCIYEKAACFSYREVIVIICICKFQIQVQVFSPPDYTTETIDPILVEIQTSLKSNIQTFKYEYKVGYKCTKSKLFDDNDNSFCALEDFPNEPLCTGCVIANIHRVNKAVCWIKESSTENSDNPSKIEERNDEGARSITHILTACIDGNIQDFLFHLQREICDRTKLLERPNESGWNALHYAAKGGNLTIFEKLISKNIDIGRRTNDQMTVLHIASRYGHVDVCKCILENKTFTPSLNAVSSQGKTACHYAAEGGSVTILELLIDKGIDPKAATEDKKNIFHIACIYSQLEMCHYIANLFPCLINAKDEDKWSAVMFAAKNGHIKILEFLKEKGVIFTDASESDRNALHIACDNGRFGACKFIAENCPALLKTVDHKGRHAGHFAVRSGSMDTLRYLETKMDVTNNTKSGMNILHMACLHCHSTMCEYILFTYPNLNRKVTDYGWTTAHFLAGKGNNKGNEPKIFQMLLNAERKVDIMLLTKKGNSVLTLAIKYNNYDFAEYLFLNYRKLLHITNVNDPRETGNNDPKMNELLDKELLGRRTEEVFYKR